MWSQANPFETVVDEMVNLTSTPIAHTIKRIEKKVRSISIASFLSVVNCCFVPTTFGVICIYILYIHTLSISIWRSYSVI